MPTIRSIVNEARFKVMQVLLKTDILLAQAEYSRVCLATRLSEQAHAVNEKLYEMSIVQRRSLGTSTFEDSNDHACNVRVAALELVYQQRVSDAFLHF